MDIKPLFPLSPKILHSLSVEHLRKTSLTTVTDDLTVLLSSPCRTSHCSNNVFSLGRFFTEGQWLVVLSRDRQHRFYVFPTCSLVLLSLLPKY